MNYPFVHICKLEMKEWTFSYGLESLDLLEFVLIHACVPNPWVDVKGLIKLILYSQCLVSICQLGENIKIKIPSLVPHHAWWDAAVKQLCEHPLPFFWILISISMYSPV